MREVNIERRLVDLVKCLGGVALKGENVAGFPDRIVLMPGGGVYFVEVKQPGGRLSDRQIQWMYDLIELGMNHRQVWNSGDLNLFRTELVTNATARLSEKNG